MSRRMRCPCIVRGTPHHRLRRSLSSRRSLLVRRFQAGLQIKTNSAGGNGGRLAPPFVIVSRGRLRLFPSALPIKLLGEAVEKRQCRRAGGENFRSRFPARGNFHTLRIFRPCFAETQENPQNPAENQRFSAAMPQAFTVYSRTILIFHVIIPPYPNERQGQA